MSSLLPLLLHWLHEYGYAALWLTVFIAAVGVPLPISLVLLAAGAFAVRGDFNIALLIVITITASTCGDNVGYFIGRHWGSRTLHWLGQPRSLRLIPSHAIIRSRLYFQRRGGRAIFFSRFLFSALGGVTNLLAGADRYSYHHFLLYDVAGETLGTVIPLSLGYAFGVCWEAGGNVLGAFSGFTLALFVVVRLVSMLPRSKEAMEANLLARRRPKEEKPLAHKGKKPLPLEGKIEEHKAFLRYFQNLMGPECLKQMGGIATIDRRLIMIDALVTIAQTKLQPHYNANTLANYLYAVFTTVRDDRMTTDPMVLAIEAEYQRRGGTDLNEKHSVLFFTTGSLYEHMSGKELSAACNEGCE
jgi:membrane-associated protein